MKHIGWCLEQIQIVMSNMPGELKSKEDEDKARFIIARVQEYAEILAKLILHPKFKQSLHFVLVLHWEQFGKYLNLQWIKFLVLICKNQD